MDSINFNLHSRSTISFIRERVLPTLSDKNKHILLIVTVALGLVAACYSIYSRYRLKVSILKENKKFSESKKVAIDVDKDSNDLPIDNFLVDQEKKNVVKREESPADLHNEMEDYAIDEAVIPLDQPQKNVLKDAHALEYRADLTSTTIDQWLKQDDSLSENDKQQLLLEKDRQIKIKNIAQDIAKLEQKEITFLQEAIKQNTEKLEKEEANYEQIKERLSQLQNKIDDKNQKIENLIQKKDSLAQGTQEILLEEISYSPGQEIVQSGSKVKASEYVGELTHWLKISKEYLLIPEDTVSTYNLNETHVIVARGIQYRLLGKESRGGKINYCFETNWKGDGVLPCIKIYWLASNADINSATIINCDAEIQMEQETLKNLKTDLNNMLIDQKRSEDQLNKLKMSLDNHKAF